MHLPVDGISEESDYTSSDRQLYARQAQPSLCRSLRRASATCGTDDQQIDTVVQPDISVVCDPQKLKENRGCLGAPDWVIEVLSPGTAIHDQRTKRALYERHGVAEYWLVHPGDRSVTIYRLQAGVYGQSLVLGSEDDCSPQAFPELVVSVAEIFHDLPPQDDVI